MKQVLFALCAGTILTPPLAAQTELVLRHTIGLAWEDEPISWEIAP